mgnify:CR=1 FL=1
MIIAIVSLFVLAFIEMLAIGSLQNRLVRMEKVVLALSVINHLGSFTKVFDGEE